MKALAVLIARMIPDDQLIAAAKMVLRRRAMRSSGKPYEALKQLLTLELGSSDREHRGAPG